MKIDLLDPVVEAAPGQTAVCRVRVVNDSAGPAAYRLRVVGLYEVDVEYALGHDPLPAGAAARFDVGLDVPKEFAAGRHSLAVEISSDRRDERPVLAGMTVDVSSIQKVALRVNPSTVAGRLKGKFKVEIDNREDRIVDLDLSGQGKDGQGQDLDIRFGRKKVQLRPGDSVSVSGSVRGRRRLVRDPVHHVLTVAATGRSAPVYADAAFQQRPLLPRRLRSGMAVLALLGLWAGILGGGAYWYTQRDNGDATESADDAAQVDLDGDGVPDPPLGSLAPGDEAGADDAAGADGGAPGAGEGEGAAADEAQETKPTSTVITGTVKAGDTGENADVNVSLEPATLGGAADRTPAETASLGRGGSGRSRPAKIWPARYNRATVRGVSAHRSTDSILSALSDGEGVWMFTDVLIPDNYELIFAKPGFDTQSFIVTPPEDGTAVEMEVVLEPAAGGAGGIVTGPDGPLGGADIVITDGVLTFNTTTSSEAGSVGTWSVAGLSTPNTYTLTATLRGFGTEVQQVPLDPGQQRTDLSITMRAGVGTISGHVLAQAAALGGVSITASSGELSRTTTSLTLGDSGSYSLPQLKIPGTYTVTASADGYLTQTRELTLSGNAPDIDFTLVRTTGSITGLVVSDVQGNLPGVGITVLHDDLSFNSATAVAPSAGTFLIDELPPGEYLVSFTRFDHAGVSQLVTIAAGETKDLGTVMMTFRARPPLVETGRLVVTVFDSATVPLGGATVQILRVSDSSVVRQATDTVGSESSFAFDNVPIGTYLVRVSRPNYRTAVQRVTMGLREVRITFNLLQLGQVTGRIVDAVSVASGGTVVQLNNYEIRLYRLRNDGTRDGAEIERIVVPSTAVTDADGNILWQSRPTSLTDGVYEVEVSVAPPGYGVTANQALDPADPAAIMRFTVDPTDEGTIRLNDIRADPYPMLSGRIFVPRLDGVDPNDIGFDPLDADASVRLTCEGSTGSAEATLSNEIGGTGLDTYTFTPIVLDQQDLLGNCTLRVSSAAFQTADIPVGTPLVVSSGGVRSDRIVNIAIARVADDIFGDMYWLDTGRTPNVRIPVSTVNLITEGDVITGFAAAPPGGTNLPVPILADAPVAGQNVGGVWSIPSHVFGKTTYVFSGDDAFEVGKLSITIDEADRTVTVVQNLSVDDLTATDLQVRLAPEPGSITGTLETFTVDPTPGSATPTLEVDATSPAGPVSTQSDPATGTFTISPAAAGTWDLLYTAPDGYRFKDTGATESDPPAFLLDPAEAFVDTVQLVQLATLDITVEDEVGAPIQSPAPTLTVQRIGTGIPGDPGDDLAIPAVLDASGRVVIDDLPVNWIDPLGTPADYRVTVAREGYDTETVLVSKNGAAAESVPGTNIGIPIVAGQRATMEITLSRFGTIAGTISGSAPWATPPASGSPQADLIAPSLVVTAVRTLTLAGGIAPATPTATVTIVNPTPTVNPTVPTSFTIVGPPGFYTITVSHPSYFDPPLIVPVDGGATTPVGLFRLDNVGTNPIGEHVLQVRPSAINVTAIDGAGNPISGAVIKVTGSPTTGVADSITGLDGRRTVGNLGEGTYTVEVRKLTSSGVDERFPVRVDLTLTRGEDADARSVDLTVRLVSLAGSITGNIGAVNALGRPVALPETMTITRVYTVGDTANVEGVDTPNDATEEDLSFNPPNVYTILRGTPPETPRPFTLFDLPTGVHELTFSQADAYTSPTGAPPAEVPLTANIVTSSFAFADQINYTASDVTVQVTVVSGRATPNPPLLNATAVLIPTWRPGPGGTWLPGPGDPIPATAEADGVFTFVVAPDLEAYTISVTDDDGLHSDNSATQIVVPPSTADFVAPDIVMTPSAAAITGLANKQEGAGADTVTALVSEGVIDLLPETGTTPVPGIASVATNGVGGYTFPSVTSTGPFRIRVALTGFVTTISAPFSVTLGQSNAAPTVTVPRLAAATITVNTTVTPTSAVIGTTAPATSPGVCTTAQCSFSGLVPGVTYTFNISPSAADANFYFAASTTATPAIGGTASGSVTLAERTIVVQVTTTGSTTDSNTATVALAFPSTSTAVSQTGTGSSTYTFAHVPKGSGTVTVSREFYRTATASIAAITSPVAEPPIAVTLTRSVTSVSGNITDIPAGFAGALTVRATSNDATPVIVTGTVTGTGTTRTYSIPNVPWGTWTITADGLGAGAGTAASTVVVNGTSATTATRDIDLDPRTVSYNFTVTSGGVGLGGVTIEMAGASGTTSSSGAGTGTVTLSQGEREGRAWTARLNGHITNTGTAALVGLTNPVAVAMQPIPTIVGDVRIDGVNVTFDNVFFCRPESVPGQCGTGGADLIIAATAGAATGSFTVPSAALQLAPGSYRLRAVKGTDSASTTISLNADGTVTSSIVITLPTPPPPPTP